MKFLWSKKMKIFFLFRKEEDEEEFDFGI